MISVGDVRSKAKNRSADSRKDDQLQYISGAIPDPNVVLWTMSKEDCFVSYFQASADPVCEASK